MARAVETAQAAVQDNQENARAQRFYGRHGFAVVGAKRFRVGDRDESDFVMELELS